MTQRTTAMAHLRGIASWLPLGVDCASTIIESDGCPYWYKNRKNLFFLSNTIQSTVVADHVPLF